MCVSYLSENALSKISQKRTYAMSINFLNLNEYLFTHWTYLINQVNKKGEPLSELFYKKLK